MRYYITLIPKNLPFPGEAPAFFVREESGESKYEARFSGPLYGSQETFRGITSLSREEIPALLATLLGVVDYRVEVVDF